MLTAECPIPTVLEGRDIGRWCLPWARVSTLRSTGALEDTDSDPSSAFILAKDSNGKSIFEGRRATSLSNAEEQAHGLPLEVGGHSGQHERTLTCAITLGYWLLFGGQDQRTRGNV